jgi:H+/Cl- antiporter ClcA
MTKKTKKNLALSLCFLPLFLFFAGASPIFAADPWEAGLNLARDNSGLPETSLDDVILTVLKWLLLIFTFIAVIAFIVAGLMFLTSGGNSTQTENAKNYVKYAIIGIAVGLSGYVILNVIDSTLRGVVQS